MCEVGGSPDSYLRGLWSFNETRRVLTGVWTDACAWWPRVEEGKIAALGVHISRGGDSDGVALM